KAELLRRFWSIRSYAQERQGLGWERWSRQSRKSPQPHRSHKPRREANGRAQCGKSACCVVCPEKAGVFSRSQSCRGRSQSPVVWIAEERETEPSKPIDKASLGEVTSHRAVTRVNALWPRKCVSPRAEPPTWGRRQNGQPNTDRYGWSTRRGGSDSTVTQHADFPHCALPFASRRGLWDLSCWGDFR